MRTLLAFILLIVVSVTHASDRCSGKIDEIVIKYKSLSCEEKLSATEWLNWAMYPPDEKEPHKNKWENFLNKNPEIATQIIRTYVNRDDYDGAGNYEKWGILFDLPKSVRELAINISYDAYINNSKEAFCDFLDLWGSLLLTTDGFDELAAKLDEFDFYDKYNSKLLAIAIKSNYGIKISTKSEMDALLVLYKNEFKNEPGWYDPAYTKQELRDFFSKIGSKKKIQEDDIPFSIIP